MSQRASVAVITDSTSDLSSRIASEHDIVIVPLNVHFDEEVFRDQIDITTDEFMRRMAESLSLPTTSQPSAGAFESAFRTASETHDEIVCVVISTKLSGTYQSAQIAAMNVAETIKVEVVDSLNVTYGLGFQALRAVELARQGQDAGAIASTLRAELNRYHVVVFVETLEHLRRGGRIGKAAQMVGSLLQLRPLLRLDEGQVVPFERTRTRGKAMEALIAFAGSVGMPEEIAVLYNTTPDDARTVADRVRTLTPDHDVIVSQLGPVIATHIGPNVLGMVVKEKLHD